MNYQNIGEIYEANDKIREKLKTTIGGLSDELATAAIEGEKWTIAQVVEHICIVEDGMTRICAKLLRKAEAENKTSDGAAKISGNFLKGIQDIAERKLEAPEMVRPTGTKTIAESIAKMEENRRKLIEMRPLFESIDGTHGTFPHPFLGEMTAHEWLALVGGHELRHLRQIKNMLEKLNARAASI
jgi:rubrerythrin